MTSSLKIRNTLIRLFILGVTPLLCLSPFLLPQSSFTVRQVQWLFGQCLSLLQERGTELAEYERDADLLKMLVFY